MPDISMCFGRGCPLKERCVRYLSEPDGDDQTYFLDSPYVDGKCPRFWELKG